MHHYTITFGVGKGQIGIIFWFHVPIDYNLGVNDIYTFSVGLKEEILKAVPTVSDISIIPTSEKCTMDCLSRGSLIRIVVYASGMVKIGVSQRGHFKFYKKTNLWDHGSVRTIIQGIAGFA